MFVTAAHVVADVLKPGSGTIRLVLHGGEAGQRVLPAGIIGADAALDLALLKIEAGREANLTTLELGKNDGLVEAMEVTAFGYPLGGGGVPHPAGSFPSVSVNVGRITALRKVEGRLVAIQLDAVLNRGNSGGPVLDAKGKVIGVVAASIPDAWGMNYAVPVDQLKTYLAAPQIGFDPPVVPYGDRAEPVVWSIDVHAPMKGTLPTDPTVAVKIQGRGTWREFTAKALGNGRFSAQVVPMPEDRVELAVTISGQTYHGQIDDRKIQIGSQSYAMSDIQRLDHGPKFRVLTATDKALTERVQGLGMVVSAQGGSPKPLDLNAASTIEVQPKSVSAIDVAVEVRDGAKLLARLQRQVPLVGFELHQSGTVPEPRAGFGDLWISAKGSK